MRSVTPDTIKYADALCSEKYGIDSLTLMRSASSAAFEQIRPKLSGSSVITVLCGKGNNAGDGYCICSLLKQGWYDVNAVNVFDFVPVTSDAAAVYNEYKASGGRILTGDKAKERIEKSDVIIDAIFGIGFHGEIDRNSECANIIEQCNALTAYKIAVDTPSGIISADGTVSGIAFCADFTVTMALYKTGMLSYPARGFCGEIKVCDIGYPKELLSEIEYDALIPDDNYLASVLPKRNSNSSKGSFGTLSLYCGSENMTGAAFLCASGALRTGVGLVRLCSDERTIRTLQARLSEPIFFPVDVSSQAELYSLAEVCSKSSAALIGCGLGQAEETKKAVLHLVKNAETQLIIDADGINALCGNINVLKEAKLPPMLTPHPGEFARLISSDVRTVQSDRINLAKKFARDFRCILVLKGASTVICSPDGLLAVNPTGNPGLSKGGSGDVLAGMCASFAAQKISAFDSAVLSVYLHGKAGDVLREEISEYGFLPSEIPLAAAKLLP